MSDPIIVWHQQAVSREAHEALNGHRGCVVWFTGLSGSGKSTVANLVDHKLHAGGVHTFLLDGDNVRHGLNATPQILASHGEAYAKRFGLGFSPEDREENIRRIGAVAALFCDAGLVTLAAFVSPYRRDRDAVRASLAPGDFVEVFVDAPLTVCESRDPKGLYKLAREGKLRNFTGIDSDYERPEAPEVHLHSAERTVDQCVDELLSRLA